jgi:hypothetical protein
VFGWEEAGLVGYGGTDMKHYLRCFESEKALSGVCGLVGGLVKFELKSEGGGWWGGAPLQARESKSTRIAI